MSEGVQIDRLHTVSSLAATLADQILLERTSGGVFPREKGKALWKASLLLEEAEHPVPNIVVDVLEQLRRVDEATAPAVGAAVTQVSASPSRAGVFARLFRSRGSSLSA